MVQVVSSSLSARASKQGELECATQLQPVIPCADIPMSLPFVEQIAMVTRPLESLFEGREQITVCIGSGASRDAMPMMRRLISRTLANLPIDDERSRNLFLTYSRDQRFAELLIERQIPSSNPTPLEEYKGLLDNVRDDLCRQICNNYDRFFRDVCDCVGGKDHLLELLEFDEFKGGSANPCHYYIAYLLLEGKLQRIVTTNWDRLVEKALEEVKPAAPNMLLHLVLDHTSFLQRGGPIHWLIKVHGCATQYPQSSEEIIVTTDDLESAMESTCWRQEVLKEVLNRKTIFTGYSGRDYTVMVPLRSFRRDRERHDLPHVPCYLASETDLGTDAQRLCDSPASHWRMYANDLFATIYFAYVAHRLKASIAFEKQRASHERMFPLWSDEGWKAALEVLDQLIDVGFPSWLDRMLGGGGRTWDKNKAELPIRLSELRQLLTSSCVRSPGKYMPTRFDSAVDVTALLLLRAFLEVVRANPNYRVTIDASTSGMTLSSTTGIVRQIVLLYGEHAGQAHSTLRGYIRQLEQQTQLPGPELKIIPCQPIRIDSQPDLAPGAIADRALPGMSVEARVSCIRPEEIFGTTSLDELQGLIARELAL